MDNSFTAADRAQAGAAAAERNTAALALRVRELELLVASMCQHTLEAAEITARAYPTHARPGDPLPLPLRTWFEANRQRLGFVDPMTGHTVKA
jgi:hypothetical protein